MDGSPGGVSALIGRVVLDGDGRRLGRVVALVHRGDGCDVLVDRSRWLRHRVLRINLDQLVEQDGAVVRLRPGLRVISSGPADWVA